MRHDWSSSNSSSNTLPPCNLDISSTTRKHLWTLDAATRPQPSFLTLPPEIHLHIATNLPGGTSTRRWNSLLPALTPTRRELSYCDVHNRDSGDSFFLASNKLIQCNNCQKLLHGPNRYDRNNSPLPRRSAIFAVLSSMTEMTRYGVVRVDRDEVSCGSSTMLRCRRSDNLSIARDAMQSYHAVISDERIVS